MSKNLNKAIKILKEGGIIIFPTDTAFGIGCRIDRVESVMKLFEIRKRPKDKAVPVIASSISMVRKYSGGFDQNVEKLMRRYWPGGLTIVLPANDTRVPIQVRGGKKTLGLRIPNHSTILNIIREVGVPILAPSANFAGEKTPFKVSEIDPNLAKLVDFILPGKCTLKKASTVIDVSEKNWKIIREGAVRVKIK